MPKTDPPISPPIDADCGGTAQSPNHSTLDFLLRRMRHRKDFPTFSQHIIEINEKTSPSRGNYASASELANTILKDYSLTNKLLRLVNSAYYGQLAGKISTVSRAVVLLGFEQVRLAAASIMLFEHLHDGDQRADLEEEAIRSFMSGLIAKGVGEGLGMDQLEEAFICSMIHNLGKHLILYYLPEEYERIEALNSKGPIEESIASKNVLGLSYKEIGREIAGFWRFPETIVASMEDLPPGKISAPRSEKDAFKKLSFFSNELCNILVVGEENERRESTHELLKRFEGCFAISRADIDKAIVSSREKLHQYSSILQLNLEKSAILRNVASFSAEQNRDVAPQGPAILADAKNGPAQGTMIPDSTGHVGEPIVPQEALISGIEDISSLLLGKYEFQDLLTMVLETMYRGFCFDHVLFCMVNSRKTKMVGRMGFGRNIEEIIKQFRFSLLESSNVFGLALSLGKDIRIDDTRNPRLEKEIPDWYRKAIFAPAFVLFPIHMGAKPCSLFYADRDKAGKVIGEDQLHHMRILRNQAAFAMMNKRL